MEFGLFTEFQAPAGRTDIPNERVTRSMHLFAERVIPRLN